MDLKELEALQGQAAAHWYYQAKSAAMLRILQGMAVTSVLDVGAGDGFFSRVLLQHTECREAICVDPNYPRETEEIENGKPIRFVRACHDFTGNLVLMMDVLEHVPDDVALLRVYAGLIGGGTRMLITVPAMRWMWSQHDVYLEHFRRYTLKSLGSAVTAAGLRPVSLCYYFGLTLPIAAAVRLGRRALPWHRETPRSDMRMHGPAINAALLGLCRAELGVFQANRLAGLSVFALCEK